MREPTLKVQGIKYTSLIIHFYLIITVTQSDVFQFLSSCLVLGI